MIRANRASVDEVHGFIKTLDEVLSGRSAKKLLVENGQNGH